MPRPLPMKRKTTAMLGAKKLRLTLPPWPIFWTVRATVDGSAPRTVGYPVRVEDARKTGGHGLGVLLSQLRRTPAHHVEPRGVGGSRIDDGNKQAGQVQLTWQQGHASFEGAVGNGGLDRLLAGHGHDGDPARQLARVQGGGDERW